MILLPILFKLGMRLNLSCCLLFPMHKTQSQCIVAYVE